MSLILKSVQVAMRGAPIFTDNQTIQQTFIFPPEFVGFSGHFPDEPILPAVVQISMGVLLAGMLIRPDKPDMLVLKSVRKAKFTRKLRPVEAIMASCSIKDRHKLCFDVALKVEQEQASVFILELYSLPDGQ